MSTIKRWLALALVAALLMALAACGQTTDDPAAPTTQPDAGQTGTTAITESTDPTEPNTVAPIAFREENGGTIGVWWWHNNIAKTESGRKQYMDFLQENQVTEIYLSAEGMKYSQIADFIRDAGSRGMRVAWLSGDVGWIDPEAEPVGLFDKYIAYQEQAEEDAKFYALHLDVEPHQRKDFGKERETVLQYYADFVIETAKKLHDAGQKIEWDIPFWFDEDMVADETGATVPLLELLAKTSDTLCLMSYRDTAAAVLDVSKEEIALGKTYGCKIICGVETKSAEGDQVSFMEEGKTVMYQELEEVYRQLKGENLPGGYGIAIHYVNNWFKLKD